MPVTAISTRTPPGTKPRQHPLFLLNEEELDLVLQLVLASGSLKELARIYQVSYPTIRASLDRLIERLRQFANGEPPDPMIQMLADMVERGEIKVATAKSIRDLYRQQKGMQDSEEKSGI